MVLHFPLDFVGHEGHRIVAPPLNRVRIVETFGVHWLIHQGRKVEIQPAIGRGELGVLPQIIGSLQPSPVCSAIPVKVFLGAWLSHLAILPWIFILYDEISALFRSRGRHFSIVLSRIHLSCFLDIIF